MRDLDFDETAFRFGREELAVTAYQPDTYFHALILARMKIVFNLTNFLYAKMLSMLDEIIPTLPVKSGTYALWLHLPQLQNLTVGKLGRFTFPAGDYIYLGSARGPGGLRARLGRHLSGNGQSHWHIDYLRNIASVRGFGFVIQGKDKASEILTECDWSQKLAVIPNANILIPGFGASDCYSGCSAHLVYFPMLDMDRFANLLNYEIHILNDE